ncbi:MAG: LysR substrate-binding domain-containing protein [Rhizobiaceae bacterium]
MNLQSDHTLPLVDLDLLRTFVAIVETGSFASAAEAVFRTPSAVSMQMKKLEEILGKPVLVRDSRSVRLTSEGELLLEHGRRMLALNRDMVAKFVAPDVAGIVRLGAPDDVAERFLPDMLRRFADSHPAITVDVVVQNSIHLVDLVRQKKMDIAMITCESGIDGTDGAETLFREQLVWAVVKGGIAGESVPLPISVWEEGCTWRKAGLEGLERAGRPFRISFQSAYISGQRAAVLADLAVAPLPISAIVDPIVEAPDKFGLPKLPDYGLGMICATDCGPAVLAAADHLRASFAQRHTQQRAA